MKSTGKMAAANGLAGCGVWAVTSVVVLFSVAAGPMATAAEGSNKATGAAQRTSSPLGVCPPFHLRDEEGNVINPVAGENADKPYSPKQTCGECHDYDTITEGYHFTMGKGEEPTADQKARCLWALTPGIYGGTWCSPAPLYKYLSPKENESPATMDMTSFSFFTSPCGACHPGGGPGEYDREGKRYDEWMSDPASGFWGSTTSRRNASARNLSDTRARSIPPTEFTARGLASRWKARRR